MNPVDAVRTRIYNQPKGELGERAYKNGIDCAMKMMKNEGIFAFMKVELDSKIS